MKTVTWREALQAVSIDAARRAANSKPMKSGPNDEVSLAERRGAAYAFNVMAEEFKWLATEGNSREALARIRRLLALGSSADDYREINEADVGKNLFSAFGKTWVTEHFIGHIMRQDIGKRVFLRNGVLQVENDDQRAARLARGAA